jgi:hypothetical protein
LEELQTEFDWQFCRKLASLTADATAPAFGYARRFAVPSDFLRLIRLNGIDEDENFSKWEIVDGFIHTDLLASTLRYLGRSYYLYRANYFSMVCRRKCGYNFKGTFDLS